VCGSGEWTSWVISLAGELTSREAFWRQNEAPTIVTSQWLLLHYNGVMTLQFEIIYANCVDHTVWITTMILIVWSTWFFYSVHTKSWDICRQFALCGISPNRHFIILAPSNAKVWSRLCGYGYSKKNLFALFPRPKDGFFASLYYKTGWPFFRPECSLSAEDLRPEKLVHMLRLGCETAI